MKVDVSPTDVPMVNPEVKVMTSVDAEQLDDSVSPEHRVFLLWCRLVELSPTSFGDPELECFLARPQLAELATTPSEVLLDAGAAAARRGSLPLERWLGAVRLVRPLAAA